MGTPSKSILIVGMREALREDPTFDAATIKRTVEADLKKANEAGFSTEVCFVDPESSSLFDDLKHVLRKQHWDGISIGFGLRGDKEYTPLFEDIVNVCIRETNPLPRMMFSPGAHKLYETLMRNFPKA